VTQTFGHRLGISEHRSPLLRKAHRLGLSTQSQLIALAVARGRRHYQDGSEAESAPPLGQEQFSDEELATALLSPCLPYDQRAIRVGAQMLGSRANRPEPLAFLAIKERTVTVVRYLARLAKESEPQEPYWKELLAALPPPSARYPEPAPEVLPHSSRFRSETGRTSPRDPAPTVGR
jgi:hypothetical protein